MKKNNIKLGIVFLVVILGIAILQGNKTECTTTNECQTKYGTCHKVCSFNKCYSTGLGEDNYPNCESNYVWESHPSSEIPWTRKNTNCATPQMGYLCIDNCWEITSPQYEYCSNLKAFFPLITPHGEKVMCLSQSCVVDLRWNYTCNIICPD